MGRAVVVLVGVAEVMDRARGLAVKVAALVAGTVASEAVMEAVAVAVAGMTTGLPGRDSVSSPS